MDNKRIAAEIRKIAIQMTINEIIEELKNENKSIHDAITTIKKMPIEGDQKEVDMNKKRGIWQYIKDRLGLGNMNHEQIKEKIMDEPETIKHIDELIELRTKTKGGFKQLTEWLIGGRNKDSNMENELLAIRSVTGNKKKEVDNRQIAAEIRKIARNIQDEE